jgi:hypothetical protein
MPVLRDASSDFGGRLARRRQAREARCHNSTPTAQSVASTLCANGKLLPTLFIIGSLKTGTTSLWSQIVDNSAAHVTSGALTDKGDISRKEKDFFGDPSMWRRGRRWYERIWPACPHGPLKVGIDATPAYHVWHDAPANMATFFGAAVSRELRLVWMLREPVSKFWSYFWELKSYGGSWDSVHFGPWAEPKLARTRECLRRDPQHPLWPPSLPPPFTSCAPHLDHGLYEPQLRRWLHFFAPSQLLLVSFSGYSRRPVAVTRDVLLHAGLPAHAANANAAAARHVKNRNTKAGGHGRMPSRVRDELHALYDPFVERLYGLIAQHAIAVSPCEHKGTRFLDDPERAPLDNSTSTGIGGARRRRRAV